MISSLPQRVVLAVCTLLTATSAWTSPIQVSTPEYAIPPNIATTANKPMVTLAISKDHLLWGPIYTDFEDIDGDGVLDTDYKPTFKYYGYFDATKCYSYSSSDERFNPAADAVMIGSPGRYTCPNTAGGSTVYYWSGNFLNWSSMGRIDVIRKMLYGGKRFVDTNGTTVLERAYLSYDAHSYVKYYKGTDIRDYTPFSTTDLTKTTGVNANTYAGLTICNTGDSDSATGKPIMRMAKGNYRLWGTVEHQVCRFLNEPTDSDSKFTSKLASYYLDNNKGNGGVSHEITLPVRGTDGATYGSFGPELTMRVKVCDPNFLGDEKCQAFPANSTSNYKPFGLFQEFGYSQTTNASKVEFAVLTGSYDANKTAGILRRNMGDFSDEINPNTGVFCHAASSGCTGAGAIKALDNFQLYQRGNIWYYDTKAWGNPMGEMLVQALRYYAYDGSNPTPYSPSTPNDNSLGLPTATWASPLSNASSTRVAKYGNSLCRPKYNLLLSSSAVSYDSDEIDSPFTDLVNRQVTGAGSTTATIADFTNKIGQLEGINGTSRSVGATGAVANVLNYSCSAKAVVNLSDVTGVCPEAPAIQGTYKAAGAAYYANTNNIRTLTAAQKPLDLDKVQDPLKVKTLVASLSGGAARVEVPIPGSNPTKYVYITPESVWNGAIGAPLTFVSINSGNNASGNPYGTFMITWNDTLEGGDYDMDLTGFLRYDLVPNAASPSGWDIKITTDVTSTCSGGSGTYGFSVIGTNGDQRYLTHQHNNTGKIWTSGAPDGYLCGDDNYRNNNAASYPNITFNATTNSSGACFVNVAGAGFWDNAQYCNVKSTPYPISVTLHMVGSTTGTLKDPLWYAAKYGGFASSTKNANGTYTDVFTPDTTASWDKFDVNGNTAADGVPDNYFLARRPDLLETQLRRALDELARNSNAAPVVSSGRLSTGNMVYIASFDAETVSGDVKAYTVDAAGHLDLSTPTWSANQLLFNAISTHAQRQIITNDGNTVTTGGTSTGGGVNFQWAALPTNYINAMTTNGVHTLSAGNAQLALNYIRGDDSNEAVSTGLRVRGTNVFGPMVNGTPYLQTKPHANYSFTGYNTFVLNNRSRSNVLWVGSNDGMLHALNPATGVELFAYVPGALANRLGEIPLQRGAIARTRLNGNYFTQNADESSRKPAGSVWSYVDGSVFSGDVYVANGTSPEWKTYTFGTLGRGGKAVFALDTTDISKLTTAENQTNAADIFRWQFTSDDDSDLGYIVNEVRGNPYSQQAAPIVKLNNGKFAIITGNGYDSASGHAVLFVLYTDGPNSNGTWTGQYTKIVLDSTSSDNGLIGVSWIDPDRNGTADYVYAGDLKGHLWKIDISSTSPSDWKSAYFDSNAAPLPLYTTASGATPLSITANPLVTGTPYGGYMVIFGTGNAFNSSAFPNTAVTQRMYGLWEKPIAVPVGATSNTPQSFSNMASYTYQRVASGTDAGNIYTTDTIQDWTTKDGWTINLPGSSEMLLSEPFAQVGFLIFTTVRPKDNGIYCSSTPDSSIWAINPLTGYPKGRPLGTTTIGSQTYVNAGMSFADQKITLAVSNGNTNISGGGGGGGGGGGNQYQTGNCQTALGQSGSSTTICGGQQGRTQWREIPGIRTLD